jgi:hypothetical protein
LPVAEHVGTAVDEDIGVCMREVIEKPIHVSPQIIRTHDAFRCEEPSIRGSHVARPTHRIAARMGRRRVISSAVR